MPYVETSAGRVYYQERGAGAPVVLLHATGHDHRDFDGIVDGLAAGHRTIALDWPGHGRSDPIDERFGTAMAFAAVLGEVVERLGLDRAVLIGNSVGGYAAARFALERPDQVAGLVLVNTGGFVDPTPLTRLFCRVLGTPRLARLLWPRLVKSYMKARNELDRAVSERAAEVLGSPAGARVAAGLWRSFAAPDYDLRAEGPRLGKEVVLVWGAKDTVLPMRAARQATAAIPQATLHTFDTGHVVFASDPTGFLGLVEPFVQRTLPARPGVNRP